MQLFTLQRCNIAETTLNAGLANASFHTVYQPMGAILTFEDNPSNADLWNVPRRQEHIYTMNLGGVNIDMGIDRSKQDMKMTLNVATQKFYEDIMNWYLYDEYDQTYVLKSHRNENWIVKWKDISPKYIGTLPNEFKDSVPMPTSMAPGTPFAMYADIYEIEVSLLVVDYNINAQ